METETLTAESLTEQNVKKNFQTPWESSGEVQSDSHHS